MYESGRCDPLPPLRRGRSPRGGKQEAGSAPSQGRVCLRPRVAPGEESPQCFCPCVTSIVPRTLTDQDGQSLGQLCTAFLFSNGGG